MSDEFNPHDDFLGMSESAGRIYTILHSRIVLMEAALGAVHKSERATGIACNEDKVDLRGKLMVCYIARDAMSRGRHHEVKDLTQLLLRVQTQMDHKRFTKLGPITHSLFEGIDIGVLGRKLAATSND
jgi:hypothetical protein